MTRLLEKAFRENWILITNDKDFGEKVYRERRPHRGVVFLRLADERTANKVLVLERLLAQYAEQLPDRFVVVTDECRATRDAFKLTPAPLCAVMVPKRESHISGKSRCYGVFYRACTA